MDGVAMYRDTRERTVALGRSLTDEQGALHVPATPEWTVRDNFAHLAGAAADITSGRLDGAGTDPWTKVQVDQRRDHTLGEIIDEFESLGPAMDELIGAMGDAMDPRVFIDEWTHEQDIRGALAIPGGADSQVVSWGAPLVVGGWARSIARAGLLALSVRCEGQDFTSGEEAKVRLSVDGYTALRITVGRRSRAQMLQLDWQGTDDPGPYLDRLVVFSIADIDIVDAV